MTRQSAKPSGSTPWSMAMLVWLCRLVVGGVFIVSGVSKCIDPWGTIFKIEEYLGALGWDVERGVVTAGAILMSVGEGLLGAMMLLGCYRRSVTWLLTAVMAVMLPLTVWIAVDDPVSDCGCFGDFLIISNTTTMLKNVVVTLMLVFLLFTNRRVTPLYHPYSQWIAGAIVAVYLALTAAIGYLYQPLIDFRRFDIGETVATSADDADDEASDDLYEFIYSKNGSQKAFGIDNLPDSTWTFVDRRLKAGVSAADTAGEGLPVYDDGEEVTQTLTDGSVALIAIPEPAVTGLGGASTIERVAEAMSRCDIRVVGVIGGGEDIVDRWNDRIVTDIELLYAEPTTLKELARGPESITLLNDGRVEWKRSLTTLSADDLSRCEALDDLSPAGPATFWTLTLIAVGALIVLLMLDRTGKAIVRLARRKSLKRLNEAKK